MGALAAACAATAALAMPGVATASVGVVNPASFTSNGTLRDGRYWVHQDTETASWKFNITSLSAAKPGQVYLNVEAMVSNQSSGGGSGYSARAVRFTATCGQAKQVLLVHLVNHFRPTYPGDTLGIGQTASGHSSAPRRLNRFAACSEIVISVTGPFAQQRAIGLRQASATIGYS